MLELLYKRVLRKFNLSKDQLVELKDKLTATNICSGPFIQGNKMCPNTVPLAIKENITQFSEAQEVKRLLKKYKVGQIELIIFYVLYDIPAMISERFFKNSLERMKTVADQLIQEKLF